MKPDVKYDDQGAPYTSGMGGGDPGGYLPSHPDDPDPSELEEKIKHQKNLDGRHSQNS
jgi:hypothetical protein